MADDGNALARTHLRFGRWSVLVFLTLGALLLFVSVFQTARAASRRAE